MPDKLANVDFMVKDSKRFADSGGWGYAVFEYNTASDTFKPGTLTSKPRSEMTPSADSPATRKSRRTITSSRLREKVEVVDTHRAWEWMPVTGVTHPDWRLLLYFGGTKLFVKAQFVVLERTMVESRIPFPRVSALFVAMVEFACGAALTLGLLTPLCAAMLMGDMVVAIVTNRIHSIRASGVLAWLDDFLYLPEVLYVLILFWLIFSGPGRYSGRWFHRVESVRLGIKT